MKKKNLIILIVALVVLIGGSAVLYKVMSSRVDAPNTLTAIDDYPDATPTPEPSGTEQETPSKEDLKAPDFTVYDADGNAVQLYDYVGQPLVLNFWASWCGPCKMEMPHFQKASEQYAPEEVTFLMINMTSGRETQANAQAFVMAEGYTFPVLFDLQEDAARTYGIMSLPTTLFLDKDGNLAAAAEGMITEEMLAQGIDMAMNPENYQS